MVTCVPLNASHFSQILSIGTQVFREDDVSVLGDALHTACAPSSVVLAPDGSVAAFAVFCQGAPLSTRISSYHIQYAPLFVQIGEMVGPFYELAFLAVHPTHQGARLGATLLTRCLEDLKKSADAAACWLVVDAGNAGAQRLYERNGFQPLGTLCGTPLPSIVMFRTPEKIEMRAGEWLAAVLPSYPITSDAGPQITMHAVRQSKGEDHGLPPGELRNPGDYAGARHAVCRPEPVLALRV